MDILTHSQIWSAIDALAAMRDISVSALAKKSGLDSTSFNPSKRFTAEGRERWPSTESIAKILKSTETSVSDFMDLVQLQNNQDQNEYKQITKTLPLIGLTQAGTGGFFDDGGYPMGQGWEQITSPTHIGDSAYAMEITDNSMMPLYRDGDIIIIDPSATIAKGDRIVTKTLDGQVFANILEEQSEYEIKLKAIDNDQKQVIFLRSELEWVARIIWASQ